MRNYLQNSTTKQKLLAGVAALVVVAAGWQLYSSITYEPEQANYVPLVRTLTVGTGTAQAEAVYPGEVKGRFESQLAFQASGKINRRLVNVGDRVSAGQVLMTLDPKDINQSMESANAQLASAISAQQLAATNAERYRSLYAQGAASRLVLDQYNNQLEAANAALRQAQANVNANSNQLEYTNLISDADGVIAAINGEVGQVVSSGSPMVTVVRDGEREIHIDMPENVAISVGQKALVTFWALQDVEVQGAVREIAPMADSVTRTYAVAVAVPNLPAEARLGMTAKVQLLRPNAAPQEIIIPAIALYNVDNKQQVWLVRSGHAQLQPVTVAGYTGNNVRIASGLAQGDVIITAGLSKLTPNQEVRTAEGGEQ